MSNDKMREAFEAAFPLPPALIWSEEAENYVVRDELIDSAAYRMGTPVQIYRAHWRGFLAALTRQPDAADAEIAELKRRLALAESHLEYYRETFGGWKHRELTPDSPEPDNTVVSVETKQTAEDKRKIDELVAKLKAADRENREQPESEPIAYMDWGNIDLLRKGVATNAFPDCDKDKLVHAVPLCIGTQPAQVPTREQLLEEVEKLNSRLIEAQYTLNAERAYRAEQQGDDMHSTAVHYWQNDREDHLESLCTGVPVVIEAETLRELLQAQPAAQVPDGCGLALQAINYLYDYARFGAKAPEQATEVERAAKTLKAFIQARHVVVPDAMPILDPAGAHSLERCAYNEGWNDYRDAMLLAPHSGEGRRP